MRIFPSPRAYHNPRQFFFPDDPPAGDPPKGEQDEAELSEKGKAALQRERDARKAAEKSLTDLQATVEALNKFKTDTETAAAAAATDRARAQGEFETLAKTAEGERDTAKADLVAAQAAIKDLQEAISTGLEDGFKALPETVQKLYKGGDEDVLAKFRFVHDPDLAEVIKGLEAKAPANNGNQNPVDPANPNAPKVTEDQMRASQAPMYQGAF